MPKLKRSENDERATDFVEDYIRAWPQYVGNVASLPSDASSVLIRWFIGGSTSVSSMSDFVRTQRIVRH